MTYRRTWQTILHHQRGTFEVEQRFCGDHGLSAEILKLRIDGAGFHLLDDAWWECDMARVPPRRTHRLKETGR